MGRGPVRAGGGGGQGEGEDRPRAPGGGAVLTSGCAPGPGGCPGSAALAGCRGPETPHDELPHHRDPCAVTVWWPFCGTRDKPRGQVTPSSGHSASHHTSFP